MYAALVWLEDKVNPEEIGIELRIYQDNDIDIHTPTPKEIRDVMKIIVEHDKIVEKLKRQEEIA